MICLAYKHNFWGIKTIANKMGDNLEKSINEIGSGIDSGIKSIQKVFGWEMIHLKFKAINTMEYSIGELEKI